MRTFLAIIMMALMASAALAQPVVRQPTDDEIAAARGHLVFAAQEGLKKALFGVGKLPKGCAYEAIDPSGDYVATNLAIVCGDATFSACDAQGVNCGE